MFVNHQDGFVLAGRDVSQRWHLYG